MRERFLLRIVFEGGPIMIPIIACAIAAFAVAVERFFTLRRARINTREFMATIRTVLRQNKIAEAIEVCEKTAGPIARILKAGMLKHGRRKRDIREAIEDAGQLEIPRLERYLGVLATVASISPLLGLLGTVAGMIKAFGQIQAKMGVVNPSDLAEGIGNALITTAAGLVVAIPTLVLYNYFVAKVENMILDMEISSSELVDLLTESEKPYEV
jgi:biopolymer transport protein ExbB